MYAPDIIFEHFDRLYQEIGQEEDLWKDCEDYFFSFLRKEIYKEAWLIQQVNRSPNFRKYVNLSLGEQISCIEKERAA